MAILSTVIPTHDALSVQLLLNQLHQKINTCVSVPCTSLAPFKQPIHVLYGGAHLFKANTIQKMGEIARATWQFMVPDSTYLKPLLGDLSVLDSHVLPVYERVCNKLNTQPIEDFRIDFEDGYGCRDDSQEDQDAVHAATALSQAYQNQALSPSIGMRIKALTPALFARSTRTLDVFFKTLKNTGLKELPTPFIVTLPKVTHIAQVQVLVQYLSALESCYGFSVGATKIEIMIETPQALFDHTGRLQLLDLVKAAENRCLGAHLGAYDYTALHQVVWASQTLDHPACDWVRQLMKVAYSETGIFLADGAVNEIPVGPHRGALLTEAQMQDNRAAIRMAWKKSQSAILRALHQGFYQGWDLHPAQVPIRYATVYYFFLLHLSSMTERLREFMQRAAQAMLLGQTFDDAATGQGLLNYFIQAYDCGAITQEEVSQTGLSIAHIKTRSFFY